MNNAVSSFCSLKNHRRDGASEGVPQSINKRRYIIYTAKIYMYFFSLIPKRPVIARDHKLHRRRFILIFYSF